MSNMFEEEKCEGASCHRCRGHGGCPAKGPTGLMRGFGHSVRKLRHVTDDVQRQFEQRCRTVRSKMCVGDARHAHAQSPAPLANTGRSGRRQERLQPASRPRPSRARVGRRQLREAERARAPGESSGGKLGLSRGHGEAAYRDALSSRRLTQGLLLEPTTAAHLPLKPTQDDLKKFAGPGRRPPG